tara:strand:+ start:228 stop:599 length:372 start_codon:yes stop_codon:yes gene_type:complete
MARGYQPAIPLNTNSVDGPFVLTKTFNENAKQNLKMIILTEKGEKLTDIDFGAGLRKYLFEPEGTINEEDIKEDILEQVSMYASYIEITNIDVIAKEQVIAVKIDYNIEPTNTKEQDIFEVTT